MENDFVLAIDIKTNGERGECFWIAAVVFNKKEKKQECFFNAILDVTGVVFNDGFTSNRIVPYAEKCILLQPDDKRRPEICESYYQLRNCFWTFYYKWFKNSDIITDSSLLGVWNLFNACSDICPRVRESAFTLPLLDISSMLFARKFNPNVNRQAFIAEAKCSLVPDNYTEGSFDPLSSALITLSIWNYLMNTTDK